MICEGTGMPVVHKVNPDRVATCFPTSFSYLKIAPMVHENPLTFSGKMNESTSSLFTFL